MCDPVSIGVALGATALSAGGQMIQQKEADANAQRAVNAANSAADAERIRQQKYQGRAADVFDDSVDTQSAVTQKEQLEAEKTKRAEETMSNVAQSTNYTPSSASAPKVVTSEIGRRIAEAVAKGNESATNRGNLSAWNNMKTNNSINLADASANLGLINNLSQGSVALLPLEQRVAAKNSQKKSSGIGELLQLGGTALGLAGGLGAFNGIGSGAGAGAGFADGGGVVTMPGFGGAPMSVPVGPW